jgi:hypothetical protein
MLILCEEEEVSELPGDSVAFAQEISRQILSSMLFEGVEQYMSVVSAGDVMLLNREDFVGLQGVVLLVFVVEGCGELSLDVTLKG